MLFQKTQSLGTLGEEIAAKYLRQKGFVVLEMNFKNNFGRQIGEIDLIAQKGTVFIFVEVKTRKFTRFNAILPEQNITRAKLYKLNKIAQVYLRKIARPDASHRFDAISVLYNPLEKKAQIRHLENIFF